MQIQRRQFGEFRTRSTSLGYSLASRNRSFRYFRVSERPNGIFSTIRSKYLNASSISPRDWLATSRRARGRTNGFWQEKCETSSAATFSRLCKPTATSLFTSCSSSGSISMTQPLSRTPSRRAQRRSYGDSSSEFFLHAGRGDAPVRDASSGQGHRRYWNFLFKTSLQ